MMADENVRENIMLPPPAPRKVYVRKMINVSAKVRRKLNFDVEDETPVAKKVKLGPVSNFLLSESNSTRTFQPIAIGNTLIPEQSTNGTVPDSRQTEQATGLTTPLSAQTNLNELFQLEKESSENHTLKVDSLTFTTPDKCVCKIKSSRDSSVFVSRIKGPLRL